MAPPGSRWASVASAAVLWASQASGADSAVWSVWVDGRDTGEVAEFRREGAEVWAPPDVLSRLGFSVPPSHSSPGGVLLDPKTGWRVRIDEAEQRIAVEGPRSVPSGPVRTLEPASSWGPALPLIPGWSLDYDASVQHASSGWSGGLYAVGRAFGPWGRFETGQVWGSEGGSGRLDTVLARDRPEKAQTTAWGDGVSQTPGWARPVRFGGVHWGTDFSTRPDLITYPLPSFEGQAVVPSSVDVLIDGLSVQHADVPAGPFRLPQLPVFGNGAASVVVRDTLGREQAYRIPFFADETLLRPGLAQFSLDAGFLRRSFPGNDYGPAVASGTYRYGWTDGLTAEAHGEAAAGLAVGGAGLIGRWGDWGVGSASLSVSRGAGCVGRRLHLASRMRFGDFTANAAWDRTQEDFCDLGTLGGTPVPRELARLGVGWNPGNGLYLQVTGVRRRDHDGETDRVWAVNGSRRMHGGWFLTAGWLRSVRADVRDRSVQLGVLIPWGSRGGSVSLDARSGAGGRSRVRAELPPPSGPGWGGYAEAGLSDGDRRLGSQVRTRFADWTLEWDQQSGSDAQRLQVQGTVGQAGGVVFAARTAGPAFAVVETGVPGVGVYRENRWVGTTDTSGRLVVPDLQPFSPNRLALDPTALPPDIDLVRPEQTVVPARGGAVRVRFGTASATRVVLTVLDAAGKPVPPGTPVRSDAEEQRAGFDGAVYLTPPAGGLRVGDSSRACVAHETRPRVYRCGDRP